MNLNQSCFNVENINGFVADYLKECKDAHAAEHIMDNIRNFANDMDCFPGDEWRSIALEDGTEVKVHFVTYDEDGDEIDDTEYIDLYLIKNGLVGAMDDREIYKRKVNEVQPIQHSMKTFRMKYIVKEYAIVEVTAEDEEKAKEQILQRANEGEFDGDMVGGDCEFECLGEVKDFEVEVKMTVFAKFRQKGTDPVDAIETVKSEIANGEFDLALLTDYDKSSAQVVYLGNPDEKNNSAKEA